MHHHRLLPLSLLVLAVSVHCDQDYQTGVRYSNEPMLLPSNYFELMRRSATSPALAHTAKISPRAASSAFFSKPSHDSSESGEVYKKAASEYWGHDDQGESQEDQSDYGHQQQQQQSHGYMPSQEMMGYMRGKEISITPDHKPITLHYRTHSQPIMVHQTRIPGPKPEVKYTKSHEEPHKVIHEVVRPIIQEVREVIQPYRKLIQEIRPVQEEIKTIVAKSAGGGGQGGMGQGLGGYGKGALVYSGMPSESRQQLYRKAIQYEPSPSENRNSMVLPSGMVLRRSKVFLKNGVPVYQSNYMGPALARP